MKKLLTTFSILCIVGPTLAQAQVSRVFVGVNGNDGNDCLSPALACRTLNAGVGKVDAQGEVIVFESGSYAGATITKAVKINVPSGVVAFSALTIDANPTGSAVVVIRGITLKALAPGSGNGLTVTSGNLFLENSVIDGWAVGMSVVSPGSKVFLKNSTLRNNTTGLSVTTSSQLVIEGAQFENNGTGLSASNTAKVAMTRSVVSGNTVAGVVSSGAGTEVTAQFCQVAHNGFGMRASFSGLVRLSDSTVTGNVTGVDAGLSGSLGIFETFTTNVIRGNSGVNALGTLVSVDLK